MFAAVPRRFSAELEMPLASSWIPIQAGIAHYHACESLQLDKATIHAIGHESGKFIYSGSIALAMRLSSQLGATPWAILSNLDKFCARTWQGSAFEIRKPAEKEAEVEWIGQPCGQVPYFREAFGAFLCGCVEGLCRKVYHGLATRGESPTQVYRLSWV